MEEVGQQKTDRQARKKAKASCRGYQQVRAVDRGGRGGGGGGGVMLYMRAERVSSGNSSGSSIVRACVERADLWTRKVWG